MEVAPGPICARCSTSVLSETFTLSAGLPLHLRCWMRETQLDSVEQEDRAGQSICPVCTRPLADGGSFRYQGEQLVHALCWRVADAETAAPMPNGDARPFAGVRILVIEDHADSRDALLQVLEVLGATVHAAGNGGDALAIAEQKPPHLVLCDLRLPGMDGFALLAALRALSSPTPIRVVAITGLGREDDLERTRAAGFDGHLVKPVDYDLLVRTLRRALGLPA
jgi:CheY-like chemotaxis protein